MPAAGLSTIYPRFPLPGVCRRGRVEKAIGVAQRIPAHGRSKRLTPDQCGAPVDEQRGELTKPLFGGTQAEIMVIILRSKGKANAARGRA